LLGFFLGGPPAGFLAAAVGDDPRRRGAREEEEGARAERPSASRALESGDELGECLAHGPAAAFLAKASCCISSLGIAESSSSDEEDVEAECREGDCCEASSREEEDLEDDLASAREGAEGECCAKGPGPRAILWMR